MIKTLFKRFCADEAGAVTVDWVVLTAAVLAMTLMVFTIITRETVSVGALLINDSLNEAARFARPLPEPDTPEAADPD